MVLFASRKPVFRKQPRSEHGHAGELHAYIRGHWQVENCLHFIKDRWWDEDRHYTKRPGLAESFASLTNAALSVLRLIHPLGIPCGPLPSRSSGGRSHHPPPRFHHPRLTLQFSWALELKPDFAEAHNNLGNAFRARGSWRKRSPATAGHWN